MAQIALFQGGKKKKKLFQEKHNFDLKTYIFGTCLLAHSPISIDLIC